MPCHNPYYPTQLTPHVKLHMPHDILLDRAGTELLLSRGYLARRAALHRCGLDRSTAARSIHSQHGHNAGVPLVLGRAT